MPVMVGCPGCNRSVNPDAQYCPHCRTQIAGNPHVGNRGPELLDEFALMQGMTEQQRLAFQSMLANVKKDGTTGTVLALLLGGLGAHHFYMGNIVAGVLYVLFCWTFIPLILSIFEVFMMGGRVRAYNLRQANLIALQIRAMSSAPVAAPTA